MPVKKKGLLITSMVVVIVGGISIGTYFLLQKEETPKKEVITSVVEEIQPTEETTSNVVFDSYSYYQSSDLDFSFVIAHMNIKENASDYSLNEFKTDEDITLDDVKSYVNKLEENHYYLGKKNVWYSLNSNDSFEGNIFIPITDIGKKEVTVTYKDGSYTFDLLSNEQDITDLQYYDSNEVISDGDSYKLSVTNIYEVTGDEMYDGENTLSLPSTARVFALKLDAESLKEEAITITGAEFITDSNTTYTAEESSIHSMKNENAIGKEIKENEQACLFFITLDQDRTISRESGILKVYINEQEEPIEVKVTLKGD